MSEKKSFVNKQKVECVNNTPKAKIINQTWKLKPNIHLFFYVYKLVWALQDI